MENVPYNWIYMREPTGDHSQGASNMDLFSAMLAEQIFASNSHLPSLPTPQTTQGK